MKEIRIGIIGTGIIAHSHMEMYAKIDGVKVVAACDIQAEKLEAFRKKYDIPYGYADYRKLLERDDLDSVDVCLHNNLHAPISIAVMQSGKNCYCEKPMAGSYLDALAMKEAAAACGVRLHIQLAQIYGGAALAAKTLIDNGRLGSIYHARSYGYRLRGRPFVDGYGEKEFDSSLWAGHGALYDMGVYHISQLLYLLGLPKVKRVSGAVRQELAMDEERRRVSGFDVEELGMGFVKFDGGLTMDILESWAIHATEFPQSSIHGSLGGLELRQDGDVTYLHDVDGYPAKTVLNVGAHDYPLFRFDPKRMLYENSQNHWVGVLRGECDPIDTPEIALQTMLISEGIFLSDRLGREVAAEEIPELCVSNAMRSQETPFGPLAYPPYPFRA
ncbi:MAG: Gfo/Idh/MocA family protein [Candidatus Spyradocola sp.]|jgi:predicted dehydrogenase